MAGFRKSSVGLAAAWLLAAGAVQAQPLFNGRDFQGWDLMAGKDMPPEGAFTVLETVD